MDPLTIGMLLASLGGNVASLFGSQKTNKNQQNILNTQKEDFYRDKSEFQDWKTKNSGSFLDTKEGNSMLTQAKENQTENNQIATSNAAMTGATNATQTAAKKGNNEAFNNILQKLIQYGGQWRNGIDSQYFNGMNQLGQRKAGLDNAQMGIEQQKAQQWANFMQSINGMASSAIMANGMGGSNYATDNFDSVGANYKGYGKLVSSFEQ